MKYIVKQIAKPAEWDPSSRENIAEITRFNAAFQSQIKLSADRCNITLSMNNVNMAELEKAVKLFRCKELGKAILRSVKSIKSYGYSNGSRLFLDYDKERKVKNRTKKSRARLLTTKRPTAQQNGILPDKYVNKIVCADSQDFLKHVPDNSIDLIITSPPYNFGLDYENNGDDAGQWPKYFEKLFAVFDECSRILKHGGRMIVNVQPLFSDYVPTHHVISNHLSKTLMWKGEIIWEKNNYNCKYTAWGSWKSPSSPYLKYTWEFIEVFCKGSLKKEGSKSNVDISADNFKKWVYAKWSIAPEKKMKKYGHPSMFPEELVRRAVQLFSFKNDIVLDPFMGVGTACSVAKALGRRYVGIDISEQYVKTAKNRIDGMLD